MKEANIFFKLAHHLDDATTFEVAVPGQRWEIDCYDNGTVEVEVFRSDGSILDEAALDRLIRGFSISLEERRDEIRRMVQAGVEQLDRGEAISEEEVFAELEREAAEIVAIAKRK